ILILDAGHFVTWEQPEQVSNAMLWFFHSMLAPGLPIFERSNHYGVITRPAKPLEGWGVNPGRVK
ncbi:MAG: hypothetical protein WBD51_12430, partial [Burkholderiaceae bacterium]